MSLLAHIIDSRHPGGVLGPPALNIGLLSYYDSDGTDRKGSNNLTPINAPSTGVGKISGTCMDLEDTSAQSFTLADASAGDFEPNQTLSYACWFRVETLTSFGALWSKGSSNQSRTYYQVDGAIITNWGGGVTLQSPPATLVNGVWNHIYVNWNASSNTLTRSINGQAMTSITGGAASSNTADFFLGSQGAFFPFDGLIDQFCVWNRELNAAERADLWNSGAGVDFLTP